MSVAGTSRRFVATYKNSVTIEGIADIRRSRAARRSDANDPSLPLAANFAVMHNAAFSTSDVVAC